MGAIKIVLNLKKYFLMFCIFLFGGCSLVDCSNSTEKAFGDAKFLMNKEETEESLASKLKVEIDFYFCQGEFENIRNKNFNENISKYSLNDIELYGHYPNIYFCFDKDQLYHTQIDFEIETLEEFNALLEKAKVQLSKTYAFLRETPYTNGLNAIVYNYEKADYSATIRAIKPDNVRKKYSISIDKWFKPIVEDYELQKKRFEENAL